MEIVATDCRPRIVLQHYAYTVVGDKEARAKSVNSFILTAYRGSITPILKMYSKSIYADTWKENII